MAANLVSACPAHLDMIDATSDLNSALAASRYLHEVSLLAANIRAKVRSFYTRPTPRALQSEVGHHLEGPRLLNIVRLPGTPQLLVFGCLIHHSISRLPRWHSAKTHPSLSGSLRQNRTLS